MRPYQRRRFLTAAGAVLIAPRVWAQQQRKVWQVGVLAQIARPEVLATHVFGGLPRGLRELGYVEGENLSLDWRFADGRIDQLPDLAAALVKLKKDVMVTAGALPTVAMQKATTSIPIVFANISDPVATGVVKALARPGGNISGVASLANNVLPKVMEALVSAAPRATRIAVMLNPKQPSYRYVVEALQAAAKQLGVRVQVVDVASTDGIAQAFATMERDRMEALIVQTEGVFMQQRNQIMELATRRRLPVGTTDPSYASEGALIVYGANQQEIFRQAAEYVDKILKGANPTDLPVQQPTKFDLTLNLKAARVLGLTIPPPLLLRADRTIE
jgi:putative ABC transport system substrate-binding protein